MTNKFQQLQNTLNDLFQTSQEDLDFGIYRIMNQKRDEIDSFLDHDLKKVVSQGLAQLEEADSEQLTKQLEEARKAARQAGLENVEEAPKVVELKKQLAATTNVEDAENDIYSHLTNFFKRYYQEGDFISQRRYKDDVYAIPYQGEEVKLHWANHDQYYIKTTENFSNYSFKLESGKKVTFRLVEASTERDNNKATGDAERKFKLAEESYIYQEDDSLIVYFEYLPLGKKPSQKKLLEEAYEILKNEIPDDFSELLNTDPTKSNKNRTVLEKRLKEYTAKNTFDYFIHKDLGGFLRRELDFYIKNELLHIDDIDTNLDHNRDIFTKIKVFKNIARKIIDFLEQIEDFQKKLWEKKKFVTQCDYLITLDHVDKKHYQKIAESEKQLKSWLELGFIEEKTNVDSTYLENHSFLTIDTQFFPEIKSELLANIDQLDEKTNGVLINSENWQAMNVIESRYSNDIDITYIDPPYNAKSSEILYKNTFKHSSWLSLMENRISKSLKLNKKDNVFICAIDENEQERLGLLLENTNPDSEKVAVAIIHNPGGIQGDNFSYTNEFAYFVYPQDGKTYIGKKTRDDADKTAFRDWGGDESKRENAKNCFYPIYVNQSGKIVSFGEVCDDNFHPESSNVADSDLIAIYPIDSNEVERKWRFARQTVSKISEELKAEKTSEGFAIWRYKNRYRYKTVWTDKKYNANTYGSRLLNNILGNKLFSYPKSLHTVKESIHTAAQLKENPLIMDYFAGSGTTGHAVISLNRNQGDARGYILIEMGLYFDSVLKPRIQKVIYSDNWKDGKPEDSDGVSQIVKYLRLESYEDTLNNLQLTTSEDQQSLLGSNSSFKEDYFLHYMLDVETRGSESLLNIDKLDKPFEYSLLLTSEGEQYRQTVDLPETFNYLIGLKVKSRKEVDNCLVYIGEQHQTDQRIAVIWRNVDEVGDDELKTVLENIDDNVDTVYINGQPAISSKKFDILPVAPEFKQRMFS